MSLNEEETKYHLINPVLRQKGYDDPQRIRLDSWTIDFAARRANAREEIQPLMAAAAKLNALDAQIREKEKAAKDLETKASDIDAAVFDLKAVNPNAVSKVDERTPQEIIGNIEQQGGVVSGALTRLARLLAAELSSARTSP